MKALKFFTKKHFPDRTSTLKGISKHPESAFWLAFTYTHTIAHHMLAFNLQLGVDFAGVRIQTIRVSR